MEKSQILERCDQWFLIYGPFFEKGVNFHDQVFNLIIKYEPLAWSTKHPYDRPRLLCMGKVWFSCSTRRASWSKVLYSMPLREDRARMQYRWIFSVRKQTISGMHPCSVHSQWRRLSHSTVMLDMLSTKRAPRADTMAWVNHMKPKQNSADCFLEKNCQIL